MKNITAYCLDWHIRKSDAFRDMLVELLSPYAKINLVAWDGANINKKPDPKIPLIFCMLPPPKELYRSDQPMVWLPMWDQAQGYSQEWWDELPKNLRIVAFSDVIYRKARAAGLPTLKFTYFKNPSLFSKVSWDNGPILFYWNRVGMDGPTFIENICLSIKPTKVIFLGTNAPGIEKNKFYKLPDKIGSTEIVNIKPSNRDSSLKRTSEANLILAPRLTEGVGMTFLEFICRGGVVLANNAPTMSEYIKSGENGFIFDNEYASIKKRMITKVKMKKTEKNIPAPYLLSEIQPWSKIAKADFQKIGDKAYSDHIVGFANMQKNIKEYADFVLNW